MKMEIYSFVYAIILGTVFKHPPFEELLYGLSTVVELNQVVFGASSAGSALTTALLDLTHLGVLKHMVVFFFLSSRLLVDQKW